MRNESDYIYYFSSEQKSEPKHAAVKCAPKHLKKHRHIRAIHLFALCYLLIAAMLMSTSGSFAKFTETSPVSVQSAKVASFNYDVQQIDVKSVDKTHFNTLTDSDVMVCAFSVSNSRNGELSDVSLSCDVELELQADYDYNMIWDDNADNGRGGKGAYVLPAADEENIDILYALYDKLKLFVYNGSSVSEISTFKPIVYNIPMSIASQPDNRPASAKVYIAGQWSDISIPHEQENLYEFLVAIDTSEMTGYTGEPLTFASPSQYNPNLKITINQVD